MTQKSPITQLIQILERESICDVQKASSKTKWTTPTNDFLRFLKQQQHKTRLDPYENWGVLYETFLSKQRSPQQNGVYYTPPFLAQYVLQQSLGLYLEKQYQRLLEADKTAQKTLLHEIHQQTICDPSCGCGVFLIEALKLLHHYYRRFFKQTQFPQPSAEQIIRNQLFGTDLDGTAVEITRWALIHWAQELDQNETHISPEDLPVFQGDALKASSQSFSWNTPPCPPEGFNFMVGNPPYLTEVRNHRQVFQALQSDSHVASFYTPKMDLADAFVYLGLELLSPKGTLAYVLPEYWLQRDSARALRQYLWKNVTLKELRTFGDKKFFKHAPGHHTSILVLEKTPPNFPQTSYPCQVSTRNNLSTSTSRGRVFLTPESKKLLLGHDSTIQLLETLSQQSRLLSSSEIQQGIVFPQGRLRKKDWERLPEQLKTTCQPHQGIFILTPNEVSSLPLNKREQDLLKPYLEPKQLEAFIGCQTESASLLQIFYIDSPAKKQIEAHPHRYPTLQKHLIQFESINTSAHRPYGLHRPRQPLWFESPHKIMGLRQTVKPVFAHIKQPIYANEGFYIIRPSDPSRIPITTALLNSQLAHFWFYHQKRKGHRLQIDKEVLLSFPAPNKMTSPLWQNKLQSLYEAQLENKSSHSLMALEEELNQHINTAYLLSSQQIETIKNVSINLR